MPRASGKTTLLIKESARNQMPIVVGNEFAVQQIIDQSNKMGEHIPEPINISRYMSNLNYRHSVDRKMDRYSGLLIDELDYVLRQIFRKSIDKVTYTPNQIVMSSSKEYDEKTDVADVEKMQNMEVVINNLDRRLNKLIECYKRKEKKMSKFKVGDIVRVKPVDEMNERLSDNIKKLASTNAIIGNVFNDGNGTFYFLAGHEGTYFNDTLLEDHIYSKDDIFNIHVIVPDKVVEIEFYDGKEKMVCHEDDTFDLRKCCFIAIAKHLYKKEYTQEGIEYMATQLTYQKKYVKIVDKALKDYKRKEEEKAEKIRREEEEKIIRTRQSLKRRKQKERRAQRHREALIDVFANSINEAKARRKKDK